jgi:hypothetical protein
MYRIGLRLASDGWEHAKILLTCGELLEGDGQMSRYVRAVGYWQEKCRIA